MLALVLTHFAAASIAPALVRALGRRAFVVLALVPAVAFGWAVAWTGPVSDGATTTQVLEWVPALGLELAFAMGSLQWVMTLVVTGIGA